MEITRTPKRLIIISAPPTDAENQINQVLDTYQPIMYNIAPCDGGIVVTCILVHESEVRKAQLAAARMPQFMPGRSQ